MSKYAPRPELADARQQGLHNIGEAPAATGVSAKMIRHYESVELIPEAAPTFARRSSSWRRRTPPTWRRASWKGNATHPGKPGPALPGQPAAGSSDPR